MRNHTQAQCRAQDPKTCRHHGNPAGNRLSFESFFGAALQKLKPATRMTELKPTPVYGLKLQTRDEKYRAQILADIERNRKLIINPKTGQKTVSIYRSGNPAPPIERGVEKNHYTHGDTHAPAGRQGRTTGVFASATMDTALRWYHANGQDWSKIEDYGMRELRVDPDTTHIYSVHNWEQASGALGGDTHPNPGTEHFRAQITKYWTQSMTLTAWYQYVQDNPDVDTRDWEVLTGVEAVTQIKPVGPKRLLDNCIRDYERSALERIIKKEQKTKRETRTLTKAHT